MVRLLMAGVALFALGGAARAGIVLHDATACSGITFCNADVTDEAGRPAGTIGYSATFANGGRLADTSFAGTFYRTDAGGAASQYGDFVGVFFEVSNPPAVAAGVTFTLQGTFDQGRNSFTRTTHVFCQDGRVDACVVTDLGGATGLARVTPLQGALPHRPASPLDDANDTD